MSKVKDDDSWYYRGVKRRDFRHGAVDESDFVDEFRYIKPHKRSKFCPKQKNEQACVDGFRVVDWSYTNSDGRASQFGHYACIYCGRRIRSWYTRH